MNNFYIPPTGVENGRNNNSGIDLPNTLNEELLKNASIADVTIMRKLVSLPITPLEKFLLSKLYKNNLVEEKQLRDYVFLNPPGKVIYFLLKNEEIPIENITSRREAIISLKVSQSYLSSCKSTIEKYFNIRVTYSRAEEILTIKIINRKY